MTNHSGKEFLKEANALRYQNSSAYAYRLIHDQKPIPPKNSILDKFFSENFPDCDIELLVRKKCEPKPKIRLGLMVICGNFRGIVAGRFENKYLISWLNAPKWYIYKFTMKEMLLKIKNKQWRVFQEVYP